MVTQDTCGFMVFCEPQKIRPWSRGTGERRTSYNPERVLYLDVYSATVRIQPRAGPPCVSVNYKTATTHESH